MLTTKAEGSSQALEAVEGIPVVEPKFNSNREQIEDELVETEKNIQDTKNAEDLERDSGKAAAKLLHELRNGSVELCYQTYADSFAIVDGSLIAAKVSLRGNRMVGRECTSGIV